MSDVPPPPPSEDIPPPPPEEPAPAPRETAERDEKHDSSEARDRFRTIVAIGIAIVSILGAVVAFTGTLAEQDARQLDQQGLQDASTQQQIITNLNATVEQDQRNLAPYQEAIKAADKLQAEAATLDSTDPTSAAKLRAQAQSYLVLARTRLSFFQGALPDPGPKDKPVQYDPQAALQRLENRDAKLPELRPNATLAQAESKHSQSVNLVGLVTLFIASLLFLTLAQFTRPSIRRLFAGAGAISSVVAVALWVVVLVTGP